MTPEFWANKKVFLTGHTGFKGSWMALWLSKLGADVVGFSLSPSEEGLSLYKKLNLGRDMTSLYGDIRNFEVFKEALVEAEPDIVIHMAAQSLVRESYADPVVLTRPMFWAL